MSHILYQVPRQSLRNLQSSWTFQPTFNRLLDLSFVQPVAPSARSQAPALDLYQDASNLVVRLEAPGLKQEDFSVALNNGTLTISAERRETKAEGESSVVRNGRVFGKFDRNIEMPVPVNGARVTASYQDGVLTVTLPQAEEAKPRQIEIK